jgi:hypothetical protein
LFTHISSALLAAIVAGLIYSNIYLWFVVAGMSDSARGAVGGLIVGTAVCVVIGFAIALFIGRSRSGASG